MLARLHIENVAVIESADLELDSGLNVLTGETGAGKSILIDSINLVLGERVSKDIVRTGAGKAHVSALFMDLPGNAVKSISELGFEADEDGSLLLQRDITAQGKSICRIQGRTATVSIVREIGRLLVNTHGQHENQALLSSEKQLSYLDKYAGTEQLLSKYNEYYREFNRIGGEIEKLDMDEAQKARKLDLLSFQVDDIEKAGLKPEEEENLKSQKSLYQNSEKIARSVSEAYTALTGGDSDNPGAASLLSEASELLNDISEVYPDIKELAGRFSDASCEVEECVNDLRPYTGEIEYDPRELDEIEERLDVIYRLKKKYGGSVAQVLEFCESARAEMGKIEKSDELALKLKQELENVRSKAQNIAGKISSAREKAACALEKSIKRELDFLDMPGVQFAACVQSLESLCPTGKDRVEFMISANPGTPPKPIDKIASGGELSRIMLAIKNVLADKDDIETSIFDEIDTGVSGRAAYKIGLKLKQVSQGRQVICVTHLAQIAAQADRHILIEKHTAGGNTNTQLRALDFQGRKRELARIIGGAEITELTLGSAEEMLKNAGAR